MLITWSTPKTTEYTYTMFSPVRHNWQIAFLWQEKIDYKELISSVFKVSTSESSIWKELSAPPSMPTHP